MSKLNQIHEEIHRTPYWRLFKILRLAFKYNKEKKCMIN